MAIEEKSAIEAAYEEYLARKNGVKKPDGERGSDGRWLPYEEEYCDCCGDISRPSERYPDTLYKHCFTLKHIANLFHIEIDALKKFEKENKNSSKSFLEIPICEGTIKNPFFKDGATNWICTIYFDPYSEIYYFKRNYITDKRTSHTVSATSINTGQWLEFGFNANQKREKFRKYFLVADKNDTSIILQSVTIDEVGTIPSLSPKTDEEKIKQEKEIIEKCIKILSQINDGPLKIDLFSYGSPFRKLKLEKLISIKGQRVHITKAGKQFLEKYQN